MEQRKKERLISRFFYVCSLGKIDEIKTILEAHPGAVNWKDASGWITLHDACKGGRVEVVRILLSANANIEEKTKRGGYTPLHHASEEGHSEVVKILVDAHADIEATTQGGFTPLYVACSKGHTLVVKTLLKAGAATVFSNQDHKTPEEVAVALPPSKRIQILDLFDTEREAREKTTDDHLLPIWKEGTIKEIKKILPKALSWTDREAGNTGLHEVCYFGRTEVVELLIDYKADLSPFNYEGNTPLHFACKNDHRDIIALLLQHRCVPQANSQGIYPIQMTAIKNKAAHKNIFECFERKLSLFYKEEKFIDSIINLNLEEAKRMTPKTVSQDTLLLGALHCLPRSCLFGFFKGLGSQLQDSSKGIKKTTLFEMAIDLRNKKAFEYLLTGNEKMLWNSFRSVCERGREDSLQWLLENFSKRNRLRLQELFYFLEDSECTYLLLQYLVPERCLELKRVFCCLSFSSPFLDIPPSQKKIITTDILDLFPWGCMAKTLTHLDLSKCAIDQLPKGFSYLDVNVIVEINLEGTPLYDKNAVVKRGKPKDIILMVKELQGGGVLLKELKLLVVGDAAVGKTTLLRGLRGEKEVAAELATDGIDIGPLELGGVLLNCWDFAGQEVYRYTHQLFLSDSSIYLILFNLTQHIDLISSQLTYWLNSIAQRAPTSKILLVGTHASKVSENELEQRKGQVARQFRGRMGGEVLVVDSLTRQGLGSVKKVLADVAMRNLQRVPRLFEDIRRSFQQDWNKKLGHLVKASELKKELEKRTLSLTNESWEWSLRVLECLGSIALVYCDSFDGSRHFRETYVILHPSWLVDVFKTVVTMRHRSFVRDGVVSSEKLRNHWSGDYDKSMHNLLFEALEKFDVVCRLRGREGGEEKVIVPCLLPESEPESFLVWIQNGEEGLPCPGGRGSGNEFRLFSTLRRSFLLKRENEPLPVGVMGKALSSMFQWGRVKHAWRRGCVVLCGAKDEIVGIMWQGRCGRRMGVHFVFHTEKSPSPPISSSVTAKGLLKLASQLVKNLFEDFYKVDYEAIIPYCVEPTTGSPLEWVKVEDAFQALCQNSPKVRTIRQDRRGSREVSIGGLAPDLVLGQGPLRFFDRNQIVLKRVLGKGGYGEVWEGEVVSRKNRFAIANDKGKEKEGEGEEEEEEHFEPKKVAVKKILVEKLSERENYQEILKGLFEETYLSLEVQHPNIVKLVGMCSQTKPPLLLLELLEGDLFTSLFDPFRLESTFERFEKVLAEVAKETKSWDMVLSSSSPLDTKFKCHLEELRRLFRHCQLQNGEKFISTVMNYLNEKRRTRDKYDLVRESREKLLADYERFYFTRAPLTLTGILRVAADVSQGLHYLHSNTPSLVHRDLKGPNIFLTRRFSNGGGTAEYAAHNILAKLGDFGLSSVLCGPYQLRPQGKIKTIHPRWTAPEILGGRDYSIESDIYSLGLVLWETRYRKRAYQNISDFKLEVEVSGGTRPELSCSDEIDRLIEKCWHSSPSERPTASKVYTTIRALSSALAPSLFPNLPLLATSLNPDSSHNLSSHQGKFVARVELPQEGEEFMRDLDKDHARHKHRVTSLTMCGEELWGGCRSGYVFCRGEGDQRENVRMKGDELTFCHFTQLLGNGEVSSIVGEKESGLVWVGGTGWISVWKSGDGGVAGEDVKFSASLLSDGFRLRSSVDSFFKLEHFSVQWRERKTIRTEEGMLSLRNVREVREVEGKRGGVGVVLVEQGGLERKFELGGNEGEKANFIKKLKFALYCLSKKKVLLRVGECKLEGLYQDNKKISPIPILALSLVGGRVWSFDASYKLREWSAAPDVTGHQKGLYKLSSLRNFHLNDTYLPLSIHAGFSCFFSGDNKQIYLFFNNIVVVMETISSIEDDRGETRVDLRKVEDIFEGQGMEREEVWCGVYFGKRKEVWIGTSEGWVWRKGAKLEKKKLGMGVRSMAIVGSEIWCGTICGEIHRFDATNFSRIENKKKEEGKKGKDFQITSFAVVPGGGVWSGSLDGSISLWS